MLVKAAVPGRVLDRDMDRNPARSAGTVKSVLHPCDRNSACAGVLIGSRWAVALN